MERAPTASPAAADASEQDVAPDDLATLPQLTDAAVVAGIKARFDQNKIYTQINSLLIGVRTAAPLQHGTPLLDPSPVRLCDYLQP